MAKTTQFLTYYIVLDDADAVAANQALYPSGLNLAPDAPGFGGASDVFSAPFKGYADVGVAEAPYIWTPWSGIGSHDGPYPLDVATFQRHTGGFWGIGGTTVRYYWIGQFVYATTSTPTVDGEPPVVYETLQARRFIEGFETPGILTTPNANGVAVSRDASRRADGFGLALRGATAAVTIPLNTLTPGLSVSSSWERFYIRLRKLQTFGGTVEVWRCTGTGSTLGAAIGITPSGQFAISNVSSGGTRILMATVGQLTEWTGLRGDHSWHKVDLLIKFNAAAFDPLLQGIGTLELFLDGVSQGLVTVSEADNGLAFNTGRHVGSALGNGQATANDLYCDLDDWVNCALPPTFTGRDWLNGSSIRRLRPTAFAGAHANWTGDVRTLLQQSFGNLGLAAGHSTLTSTTSGAVMAVATDASQVIVAERQSIGVASMVVGLVSTRGTTSGTLGYSLAGAAAVMTAITQTTSKASNAVLFTVSGSPTFADVTPIELRHVKGADVSSSSVYELDASVELVGVFGKEDFRASEAPADVLPTFPGYMGQHNCLYPRTPWANEPLAAPIAPIVIKAGTYVGNGTGQDLAFRAPVHFFFTRPLTGGGIGTTWWSGMFTPHRGQTQSIWAPPSDIAEDVSFVGAAGEDAQQQQYLIRLSGADAEVNANGVTYAYIAFMDPAARYMLCGTMAHRQLAASIVTKLINPNFTPEFGMFWASYYGSSATAGFYAKSSAEAAATMSGFGATAIASAVTFGTGQLTTQQAFHALAQGADFPYALLRRHDGNNDPGEAAIWSLGGYTGDGTASRTLTVGTAGKRPLFAFIFGGTNGWYRDPSHTTTNSTSNTGVTGATGITAGSIDGFTVSTGPNSNGVIYSYLIFWGSATAGNGGWSPPGEFFPVEPASPTDGPWPPDPDPDDLVPGPAPPLVPGAGTGEGPTLDPPDLVDDLADTACVAPTTKVANMALSRIGMSIEIGTLASEASNEAATVRRHYDLALQATLRDRPWGFATRYATLTLLAGTASVPANSDWQYVYRLPDNCLLPRRIVRARGAALDPTPPPMREAGGLLFTNETTPQLEYTARVACPARVSDATFINAWTWRLAHELAVPLTGLKERADTCWAQYQAALGPEDALHRLGSPGLRPAVDASDPDAAAAADKLQVVNLALVRAGGQTIGALTDQSREAVGAALVYEHEVRATLRDYHWPFAKRYVTLTLVAGSTTVPANPDWIFSYRFPSDAVRVRRIPRPLETYGVGKMQYDPEPAAFEIGSDTTGQLVLTNEQDATAEYTARVSIGVADEHFLNALAWRLGAALAPSIATPDPAAEEQMGQQRRDEKTPRASTASSLQLQQLRERRAAYCWARYREALNMGQASAGNEQQRQKPEGDTPDWIRGR